ncbi:retrotransposon gag domain-containing protein, partial [Vibrio vulnificus]|nr:retrotransposon gag domain-containing protein [Vibrio vulnificus]
MKAMFVQYGCEGAIQGEEKRPVKLSTMQKVEIEKRAHSLILLSLEHEVLREVTDESTAAGMWQKQESMYQKRSLTNKLYQKRRLHTLKMFEGMQVKEHVDNFNRIIFDLKGV